MCPVFSLAKSGRLAVAVSGEGGSIKMNELGWLRVRVDWPVLRLPAHLYFYKAEHGPRNIQLRRTMSLPSRSPYLVGKVEF